MKFKTFKITFKQKGDEHESVWYAVGETKANAQIVCKEELEKDLKDIVFISVEELKKGEM